MSKQRMEMVVRVRITNEHYADLMKQARHAGVTLSALLRQRAINKPVISSANAETAKSIDQIGRMLKHYYPKDKGWASAEERRKWWRLAEELREIARDIRSGGKS